MIRNRSRGPGRGVVDERFGGKVVGEVRWKSNAKKGRDGKRRRQKITSKEVLDDEVIWHVIEKKESGSPACHVAVAASVPTRAAQRPPPAAANGVGHCVQRRTFGRRITGQWHMPSIRACHLFCGVGHIPHAPIALFL